MAQIVSRVRGGGVSGPDPGSLKSGEFEPVEVRRVTIPKASGKLRKLGIPTVADRVVQASLKAVLEPIFEADFQPCSYGFRPNRRAQDAIAEIHFCQPLPRVGAGGRHPGVFRRDRSHAAAGTGAEADQGQAGPGLVKAFLKPGS